METATTKRGRYNVSAANIEHAEALFKAAAILDAPDEVSQRKSFARLLPLIHLNRQRGYSFKQITKFLHAAGFTLQLTSVKLYYNEMIADRHEAVQASINDHLVMLSDIKKATKKPDNSALTELAEKHQERIARMARKNISGMFEIDSESTTPAAQPATVEYSSRNVEDSSAITKVAKGKHEQGLGLGSVEIPAKQSVVSEPKSMVSEMFDMMDGGTAPQIPKVEDMPMQTPDSPVAGNGPFKCRELQRGAKFWQESDRVPSIVYQEGYLEHPGIPGLILSKKERLYSALLEYTNDDGEVFMETIKQKQFRAAWKPMIEATKSVTEGNFQKMNATLFKPPADGSSG